MTKRMLSAFQQRKAMERRVRTMREQRHSIRTIVASTGLTTKRVQDILAKADLLDLATPPPVLVEPVARAEEPAPAAPIVAHGAACALHLVDLIRESRRQAEHGPHAAVAAARLGEAEGILRRAGLRP